jgi:hypothetical protein
VRGILHAERRVSPTAIVLSIAVAIAAIDGLAYWDEAREARLSRDDFAHRQVTLANGVAAALELRAAPQLVPVQLDVIALRAAFAPVSEPGTMALLRGPGQAEFTATTGPRTLLPARRRSDREGCWLDEAQGKAPCWQGLSREEATTLGLPDETAIAGSSGFTDQDGGCWEVVVVATARRERDRERRAVGRLLFGFVVSSGLALAFGTLALRKQRRQLTIARKLAD